MTTSIIKNVPSAGVDISLHIGQRVRHRDHVGKRVTGIINSLQVESEQGLTASILLDEPIIIPACFEGDRETRINWQTCPVHEFTPFDDRDELIAEMLAVLVDLYAVACVTSDEHYEPIARAAAMIAKTTGEIHG